MLAYTWEDMANVDSQNIPTHHNIDNTNEMQQSCKW
jgi:hypothetical protein